MGDTWKPSALRTTPGATGSNKVQVPAEVANAMDSAIGFANRRVHSHRLDHSWTQLLVSEGPCRKLGRSGCKCGVMAVRPWKVMTWISWCMRTCSKDLVGLQQLVFSAEIQAEFCGQKHRRSRGSPKSEEICDSRRRSAVQKPHWFRKFSTPNFLQIFYEATEWNLYPLKRWWNLFDTMSCVTHSNKCIKKRHLWKFHRVPNLQSHMPRVAKIDENKCTALKQSNIAMENSSFLEVFIGFKKTSLGCPMSILLLCFLSFVLMLPSIDILHTARTSHPEY